MNKEKVLQKIDKHYSGRLYTRITRKKGKFEGISTGFILCKSEKFILIQETDEFRILGYQIIPIETIKHIRYNKSDKTYERILKSEGLTPKLKYKIDLTNWSTVCNDIKKIKLPVISECEHPDLEYFCIGELKRVNKKSISIRYFNTHGVLDKFNTKHKFEDITKLSFDDRYANIFSKYLIE